MQVMSDEPAGPATESGYEVRVRGHVGPSLLGLFDSLEATVEPVTVIHGSLRDSAELFALLARIELLGLELIGVHKCAARPRSNRMHVNGTQPIEAAVPERKPRRKS